MGVGDLLRDLFNQCSTLQPKLQKYKSLYLYNVYRNIYVIIYVLHYVYSIYIYMIYVIFLGVLCVTTCKYSPRPAVSSATGSMSSHRDGAGRQGGRP